MSVNFEDLLPDPVMIKTAKGSFPVNGLPIDALMRLLRDNAEVLLKLFDPETMSPADVVSAAPELVAKIIAIGSDSEGQEHVIRKLPTAVQMDAVMEIWALSVPDLKKLAGLLVEASATLRNVKDLETIKLPTPLSK